MNLIPFIVVWSVLAIIVVVLAISRMRIAKREDSSLHMLEADGEVAQQKQMTKEIAKIDLWGQILTVVVVVYGLALAGIYVYQSWQQSSRIQP